MRTWGYLQLACALQTPANTKVVIDASGHMASMAEQLSMHGNLRNEDDTCSNADCNMQGAPSGTQSEGCVCVCTDDFEGDACDTAPASLTVGSQEYLAVAKPTATSFCMENEELDSWNNFQFQKTLGACLAKCNADVVCKAVGFTMFHGLEGCSDNTGETCETFGECTGLRACTMSDNKRGTASDIVYQKKAEETDGAGLGVEHFEEPCYDRCSETPGPCDYCGNGYCCHYGQADDFCDGKMGKEHSDSHVCTNPPSSDMITKAAEGTEKEEAEEERKEQADEEAGEKNDEATPDAAEPNATEVEAAEKNAKLARMPAEPHESGCYLWMPSGCEKNKWHAADTAWYKDPRHDKTTCLEQAAKDYDAWCETTDAQAIFIGSDGTAKAGAEESFVVSLRADGPIVEATFQIQFADKDQPAWIHTNADLTMGALRQAMAALCKVTEAEVYFSKVLAYSEYWKGGDLLATAALNDPQWEPHMLSAAHGELQEKTSFLSTLAHSIVARAFGEGRSGRAAARGAPSMSLIERASRVLAKEDPEPQEEGEEEDPLNTTEAREGLGNITQLPAYIMGTFAIKQESPGVLTDALNILEKELKLGDQSSLAEEITIAMTDVVDDASAANADWSQTAFVSMSNAKAKFQYAKWRDQEVPLPSGAILAALSAVLFA